MAPPAPPDGKKEDINRGIQLPIAFLFEKRKPQLCALTSESTDVILAWERRALQKLETVKVGYQALDSEH
jgi:hypothetical protein